MTNNVTPMAQTLAAATKSDMESERMADELQAHMAGELNRPQNQLDMLIEGHQSKVHGMMERKREYESKQKLEHEALNEEYEAWRHARESEIEALRANMAARATETAQKRDSITARYKEDIGALSTAIASSQAFLSRAAKDVTGGK